MNLVLLNYSMSRSNLVFAHQVESAIALAKYFDKVTVLTQELPDECLPKNIQVVQVPWVKNAALVNVYKLLRVFFPLILRNKDLIVFTHMTDVHAALISPITWLMRIRHVLWYAHAHNSLYLIWSSMFVNKIVSSTSGSCNLRINRRKIIYINQGIDTRNFPLQLRTSDCLSSIVYYGRLDKSKNIHLFPSLIKKLNEKSNLYSLDIFGKSLSSESEKYLESIKDALAFSDNQKAINFKGPIMREMVPQVTRGYNLFINLFSGSLDKTLIEATFMGLPVITWNREYCSQFGTWSKQEVTQTQIFLLDEIAAINSMDGIERENEILRRQKLAIENHSFEQWIMNLYLALKGVC